MGNEEEGMRLSTYVKRLNVLTVGVDILNSSNHKSVLKRTMERVNELRARHTSPARCALARTGFHIGFSYYELYISYLTH